MQHFKLLFCLLLTLATFIYAQVPVAADSVTSVENSALTTQIATDSVAPQTVPAVESTAPAIVEESEEELILDGGEESLLPTAQDKTTATSNIAADSSSDATTPISISDTLADSASSAGAPLQAAPVSPIPQSPETAPVALKIEQEQSINFANNFKEYRSPKIAIILSLFIPGTGQAYAQNYLKTGIFGAVEATMISIGALFRYQGNKKWDDAKKFADSHYSIDKYKEYYKKLSANFNDSLSVIFFPNSNANQFIKQAQIKNDSYYNDIRDRGNTFVHGWDDATPGFDDGFGIIKSENDPYDYFIDESQPYFVYYIEENGDTSRYSQAGYSDNQELFNDKLSEANKRYRWSQSVFTLMLVNHVASAIDAGITAKAHNDRLLGKKSVWQKINIRDQYVSTPFETAQGLAFEVRF